MSNLIPGSFKWVLSKYAVVIVVAFAVDASAACCVYLRRMELFALA